MALCSPGQGASGDLLWEQRASGSVSCPEPVALGNRVFTYTTNGTEKGRPYPVLRAYDLNTGERDWEVRDRLGYHSFKYRGNGVAAARGRVFTVAARWTSRDAVSVTARDAASGALIWRRDLVDSRLQYRVYVVDAGDEGVFLLGMREPNSDPAVDPVWTEMMLLALEPRSGATLWEDYFNLGGGPDQGYEIAVGRGRVAVTVTDWRRGLPTGLTMPNMVVRTYEAATGALLWQDSEPRTWPDRLVIDRNRVFTLSDTTGKRMLIAHDLDTGERLWMRRTRRIHGDFLGATRRMVVVYGYPALGDFDDTRIQVYKGETGELIRQWKDGSSAEQMITDRGRLFTVGVPSLNSNGLVVNAYRLRSGRSRWSWRRDEPETEEQGCSVVVHRGVLVTTSTEFPGEIVTAFEP